MLALLPQCLCSLLVVIVRSTDVVVVTDAQTLIERSETIRVLRAQVNGSHACSGGGRSDFHTVLIRTRQKIHVPAR